MKTLTPDQRIEGFTELVDENENAHLTSFLAGVAHAEKILAEPEQDDEPVAWFSPTSKTFSTVETSHHTAPLFLHLAPRPEFVRLSDKEMRDVYAAWMLDVRTDMFAFARAIEDALEEKNK